MLCYGSLMISKFSFSTATTAHTSWMCLLSLFMLTLFYTLNILITCKISYELLICCKWTHLFFFRFSLSNDKYQVINTPKIIGNSNFEKPYLGKSKMGVSFGFIQDLQLSIWILRAGTIAGYKPAKTTYREEKKSERRKRAIDL